eukprot:SAG31_NODE_838_length_11617_cov_36.512936_6_plen_166_part_00
MLGTEGSVLHKPLCSCQALAGLIHRGIEGVAVSSRTLIRSRSSWGGNLWVIFVYCNGSCATTCRVTLSRLVPYFSRLKSRTSRIIAQKRESNTPYLVAPNLLHQDPWRCPASFRLSARPILPIPQLPLVSYPHEEKIKHRQSGISYSVANESIPTDRNSVFKTSA